MQVEYFVGTLRTLMRQYAKSFRNNRQRFKGLCFTLKQGISGQEEGQDGIASVNCAYQGDGYQRSEFAILCANVAAAKGEVAVRTLVRELRLPVDAGSRIGDLRITVKSKKIGLSKLFNHTNGLSFLMELISFYLSTKDNKDYRVSVFM